MRLDFTVFESRLFSELLWSVCVAGFCRVMHAVVSELSTAAWESSAEDPEEVDTL